MAGEPVDFFVSLETKVWEALVAGDPAADRAQLSEDFLGVYPSGFANRAEHAGELDDGPTVVDFEIRSPTVRVFGADHVLLAYDAHYRRPGAVAERMYISSVWARRNERWINVFSQDTPASDTPASREGDRDVGP